MTSTTEVLWGDDTYRETVTVNGKTYVNYTELGEYLLIKAAKEGDSLAIRSLGSQYGPMFDNLRYSRYRGISKALSDSEYNAAIFEAVYKAASYYDPQYGDNSRFAGLLQKQLQYVLLDRNEQVDYTVPERTMRRYQQILSSATVTVRMASDDPYEQEGSEAFDRKVLQTALELCPAKHMRPETFMTIYAHVNASDRFDELNPDDIPYLNEQIAADNEDMVRAVFDREQEEALSNQERAVLKWRYGLGYEYDDLDDFIIDDPDNARLREANSDEAVAYYLGIGRSAVQKAKTKGLSKARKILGVHDG